MAKHKFKYKTLRGCLEGYLLARELRPASVRQMQALTRVFLTWLGKEDVPAAEFDNDIISRFLMFKQEDGSSSHYRRSLRSALKALYRFLWENRPPGDIRPVKLMPLEPESWTPEEVDRLILACDMMRLTRKEWHYWRTKICCAYFTGFNACDIARIKKTDITAEGLLPFTRQKTGSRILVQLPPELLAEVDIFHKGDGPIWKIYRSDEAERMQFNRLLKVAGLKGSFKLLRKTCGTQVELLHPGRGHEHLGHDRKIFEMHYGDRRKLAKAPVMPPRLLSVPMECRPIEQSQRVSPCSPLPACADVGIESAEWM